MLLEYKEKSKGIKLLIYFLFQEQHLIFLKLRLYLLLYKLKLLFLGKEEKLKMKF